MPKLKKMPNTKHQNKYLGPYTVSRMTDSHAIIPNPKCGAGLMKERKIPIDIVRPYYERDLELGKRPTRKRKSEDTLDSPNKKVRQVKYFTEMR